MIATWLHNIWTIFCIALVWQSCTRWVLQFKDMKMLQTKQLSNWTKAMFAGPLIFCSANCYFMVECSSFSGETYAQSLQLAPKSLHPFVQFWDLFGRLLPCPVWWCTRALRAVDPVGRQGRMERGACQTCGPGASIGLAKEGGGWFRG